MLTLPEIRGSRYLLYCEFVDAGFDPGRSALAVETLLGPGPATNEEGRFEPSEEDWDDYCEWSDRIDRDNFTYEGDRPDDSSDRDIVVATGCVG